MKRILIVILSLLPVAGAGAQPGEFFLTAQRQPVQVSVSSLYQRYQDDAQLIEQVSFPLFVIVPIGSRLGLSVSAGGGAAGGTEAEGEALERLAGFADAQVGLSYHQRIGGGSIVANLGANLPSGKRELSPQEFATSILLSQNFYDFRLPTMGQGFSIAPGFIVAFPVGERLAVGGGVAYQVKGAFTPISTAAAEYDPGDELVLTGGLDVRLAETAALSADLSYTRYGADAFGGESYYEAGDRVMAILQYLSYQGFNELRVLARYSSRARGTLPSVGGGLVTEEQRTVPDQGRLSISYRRRTNRAMYLGLLVQGRFYDETAAFSQKQLLDLGFLPELRITEEASLVTRFIYTLGSFSGLEAGVGLSLQL